jgi:hypothetical protein
MKVPINGIDKSGIVVIGISNMFENFSKNIFLGLRLAKILPRSDFEFLKKNLFLIIIMFFRI